MHDETRTKSVFDRQMGVLEDLPDVVKSRPATITYTVPLIGDVQTFIVQTLRQKDVGDHLFLQYVDANGSQRIYIPPRVSRAVERQRDSLGGQARRRGARAAFETRLEKGTVPEQFLPKPKAADAPTRKRRRKAKR